MPRPELDIPIEAQGCLRLESPSGRVLSLSASGKAIDLESPALSDLRALLPGKVRTARKALSRAERMLLALKMDLNVSVSGRPLLRSGQDCRSNLVGRLLGLGSTRIAITSLAAAWLRDR